MTNGHILYDYLHEMFRLGKSPEMEVDSWLPETGGMRKWGMAVSDYTVSFWGEKIFWNYVTSIVVQFHDFSKNLWTISFKRMNLLSCELRINKKKKKQTKRVKSGSRLGTCVFVRGVRLWSWLSRVMCAPGMQNDFNSLLAVGAGWKIWAFLLFLELWPKEGSINDPLVKISLVQVSEHLLGT